jgi:hypothetical protein
VSWDDALVDGLTFIEEHVLQAPLFLMSLMRYVTPALDDLFMDSLRWVDQTYAAKHRHDPDPSRLRAMYYPQLRLYRPTDGRTHSSGADESATIFLYRFARKGAISIAVFAASYLPLVGRLVLPAASFWTFKGAVGLGPASVIFGTGLLLPRRYLVIFLQTYFASRSLVRELLEPYFARIKFTKDEKKKWFRSREGLLFGFGIGFYTLLRVPLLGVLIYGIAEAVGRLFPLFGWGSMADMYAEHRVSHHQGVRSASASFTEPGVCREPDRVEEQAEVPQSVPVEPGCPSR